MARTVLALALAAAVLALPAGASNERTLTGSFEWTEGNASGDLKAVFTPTGDESWDVSFHFEFSGGDHVYSGTAKGSLVDGTLEGTVKNENRSRTFTFRGTVADGKFEGEHAELGGGKPRETGTLSLAQ